MDIEQFRKAGYEAIDRICNYYYSLQDRPVFPSVEPGYLRKALPDSAPDVGEKFQQIADDYQRLILPGLTNWQHPSFFAYFPTANSFEGILGELYANCVAHPGFNWSASPAATELESVMMDWSAKLLGLSPDFYHSSGVGGGVIQATASDSCLIAVVATRSLYQRRHPGCKLSDLIIYTTTQTHSLGKKAALVLGLELRTMEVRMEDNLSLRGETLREALEDDKKRGRLPFILIATLGTTSTGAVDNIPEINAVVQDYPDLWIHIDAAWAGVALSCPEHRELLYLDAVNAKAHSFCTNFHKWGLVTFEASTLWVRDHKRLTDALDVTPPFLRTSQGDAGTVIDYRNWHLALGRRFRSLKFWFVLRGYGVEGFQKYIRRTIKLNEQFASLVRSSSNLRLVAPPSLALTVFRLVPSGEHGNTPVERVNELNRELYQRISARKDIRLTQTEVNGIYCIRLAVGAERTESVHVKKAYDLLVQEGEAVLQGSRLSI